MFDNDDVIYASAADLIYHAAIRFITGDRFWIHTIVKDGMAIAH